MSRPTTDSNRKPKYDIYDIRPVFDLKMYMENETYLNEMFYKNLEWFQESFLELRHFKYWIAFHISIKNIKYRRWLYAIWYVAIGDIVKYIFFCNL